MTTNVYDQNLGVMATDSRWSVRQGNYVIYLDDTGFDKIEVRHQAAFMFAGNGKRIQEWKMWLRTDPPDDSGQPSEEGVSICIADTSTKIMQSFGKENVIYKGGYFSGTGTLFAFACWSVNSDPKRSVETAKKFDLFSGGEVKFFDFSTKSHNLNYPTVEITIDMVGEAISKRGIAMKTNLNATQMPPFVLASNDEEELADIRRKIASGEISANAPCDGMYKEWSQQEKADLKKTLGQIFGWKK